LCLQDHCAHFKVKLKVEILIKFGKIKN